MAKLVLQRFPDPRPEYDAAQAAELPALWRVPPAHAGHGRPRTRELPQRPARTGVPRRRDVRQRRARVRAGRRRRNRRAAARRAA